MLSGLSSSIARCDKGRRVAGGGGINPKSKVEGEAESVTEWAGKRRGERHGGRWLGSTEALASRRWGWRQGGGQHAAELSFTLQAGIYRTLKAALAEAREAEDAARNSGPVAGPCVTVNTTTDLMMQKLVSSCVSSPDPPPPPRPAARHVQARAVVQPLGACRPARSNGAARAGPRQGVLVSALVAPANWRRIFSNVLVAGSSRRLSFDPCSISPPLLG